MSGPYDQWNGPNGYGAPPQGGAARPGVPGAGQSQGAGFVNENARALAAEAPGATIPGTPAYGIEGNPPGVRPAWMQYQGYDGWDKEIHSRGLARPVDFWKSGREKLIFQPSATVVGVAPWKSPVFDLKPQLKHMTGNSGGKTVPVWSGASYLNVIIGNNIPGLTEDLQVFSIQWGHPFNDENILALEAPEEITQTFYDGAQGCMLSWPVPSFRFWSVELRFDQTSGVIGVIGSNLWVEAALY